jgi:hypothetical protein
MAVSVKTSGSQVCTVPTEHVLATVTDAGVYQLVLDLSTAADGTTPDIFQIKTYGKARSGDTERLMEVWETIGSLAKALFRTNPEVSPHHYKVTINQLQGTSRTIPWAIYTV